MLVGAKVCDLTEDLLWFVCGLYVGILTSSLNRLGPSLHARFIGTKQEQAGGNSHPYPRMHCFC